jgi:hypothetical protein
MELWPRGAWRPYLNPMGPRLRPGSRRWGFPMRRVHKRRAHLRRHCADMGAEGDADQSGAPALEGPMLPPPAPHVAREPNWRGPQLRNGPREVRARRPATGLCARRLEDLGNLGKSGQIKLLGARHTFKMYTPRKCPGGADTPRGRRRVKRHSSRRRPKGIPRLRACRKEALMANPICHICVKERV